MVKLIRLTTDDDNAFFDNTFNQDIMIKPKSKIAIKNFSCEINTTQFTLNNANNLLSYQIRGTGGNIKNIYLSKGTYDKSNVNTLLNDITIKLNSGLQLDGAEYGKQFKAQINDSKINIITQLGTNDKYLNDQRQTNLQYLSGTDSYRRNGGTIGTNDSFFYIPKSLCKGAGAIQCKLYSEPLTANAFYIGITTENLSNVTEILPTQINYGIKVFKDGANIGIYRVINGNESDSGQVATFVSPGNAGNESFFIMIEEGKIKLKTYDGTGAEALIYETPYNGITDYYPFIMFQGDEPIDGLRVSSFRFTPDPFYSSVSSVHDDTEFTLGIPTPSRPGLPTNHFFEFGDPDFATFLGFNNQRIPTSGYTSTANFDITADNQFNPSDLSESYIIELLNVPLESFNGAQKQRQNILDTIVNTQITNDRIAYTAPYPLYIDINNSQPLTLRNIRARVLREDGSPISIAGFSQMTVLISE